MGDAIPCPASDEEEVSCCRQHSQRYREQYTPRGIEEYWDGNIGDYWAGSRVSEEVDEEEPQSSRYQRVRTFSRRSGWPLCQCMKIWLE